MEIIIREMTAEDIPVSIDGSFTVDSALDLSFSDGRFRYRVRPIDTYTKTYPDELTDGAGETNGRPSAADPDRIVYLAFAGEQAVGRIALGKYWNNYAYIEDIQVDRSYRSSGIGRRLIEQAERWAKDRGLPGIMLETQNNNAAACRFYERCGFVIGGIDRLLYRGIDKQSDEVAIFWYLLFE